MKELEQQIDHEEKKNNDSQTLFEKKQEYEALLSNQTKGAQIRSRIEYWEEGEKSTKYFFGLEKRNGKDKSWDKILSNTGETITGQHNIQKRQVELIDFMRQVSPQYKLKC